jgi:heme exporter protein C
MIQTPTGRPATASPFAASWITPALGYASAVLIAVGVVLTFLAPPDVLQGYLSRILPIHAQSAWIAYLAFFVTAASSLTYLITRRNHWDRIAVSSVEIGLVFIAFTLFSGAFWGRPTWGTFWTWDARLTTTALMFAVYVGYLMVRGLMDDSARRARVSAVIGVVASVGVPINYMSVYWWRTLHQTPTFSIAEKHSYLSGNPGLQAAFFVMFAGVTLLFFYMLRLRAQIARVQSAQEEHELEMELNAYQTTNHVQAVR